MYTPVHCNVTDGLINRHFWATLHHEGARLGCSPAWLLHQRALGRPPSVIHPRNDRGRHSGRFISHFTESTSAASRGDKTAIELFLAGIRGWEAGLWWRMDDGKREPY